MAVKRIVPDIESTDFDSSRKFYNGFLGLELVMDQGWVLTFASHTNPTSQVTILAPGNADDIQPDLSVEVDDVEHVYSQAQNRGLPIVYPLTSEPWGVTRFFVRDPNGKIVNVLSHTRSENGE